MRKLKSLNWKYALGEIALIFIGITLAIMFQNWNEARKESKLEKSVLEELNVALNNDLADINVNIGVHNRGMEGSGYLLKVLSDKKPLISNYVVEHLYMALDASFLVVDISAYEYLKAVGLHLIKNDDLRRRITKLYEVKYQGIIGIEDNNKLMVNSLFDHIKKYFTVDGDTFISIGDINQMKKNNELRFDIKNLQTTHFIKHKRYVENVKPQLEELIKLIDEELK